SSDPIPDPLLPRCVAFIQEFPEFLRTVAHCARKTELALWSSLFAVTGSPNDLFEVCLRDGQLHTAASYLIVLQSIENTQTSQEQALRLLREALSAGEWSIAKDMVRFTRAIGSEDMDSPARTPPPMRTSSSRRHATSINSVTEADDLVFARFQAGARIAKVRHSHAETRELNRKDSAGSGKRVNRHASNDIGPPSPTQLNPVAEKMGAILESHAVHLLEEYCIRDFGYFVSALELDTSRILVSSRKFVHNFPNALTRLHSQFAWPYPVASKKVVDQLEKMFGSMRCSQSAACLNGSNNAPPGSVLGSPCSSTIDNIDSRSIGSDWHGLKLLVGETSNKGSAESLAQMSHLMSWFSTAGCLDWMFLICVVSRDIVQLRREINPESAQKAGVDAFKHTMFGCDDLLEWARQNCLGYVSILHVFAAHLDIVAEAVGLPRQGAMKKPSHGIAANSSEKVAPFNLQNPPSGRMARSSRASVSNPKLQESFGLPGKRGRERSRSVDRGSRVCCGIHRTRQFLYNYVVIVKCQCFFFLAKPLTVI
ncbi:RIC1 protein, partial [Ostertagia ostertagi]